MGNFYRFGLEKFDIHVWEKMDEKRLGPLQVVDPFVEFCKFSDEWYAGGLWAVCVSLPLALFKFVIECASLQNSKIWKMKFFRDGNPASTAFSEPGTYWVTGRARADDQNCYTFSTEWFLCPIRLQAQPIAMILA